MAIVQTTDRLDVIEALINTWLKDGSVYCNNCDLPYIPSMMPCCEDPQIGTNIQHTRVLIIENELKRSHLKKDSGANQTNTMRFSLSLPPRLYQFIANYFAGYGEKFPKDKRELHRLMKRFKKFCIARTV